MKTCEFLRGNVIEPGDRRSDFEGGPYNCFTETIGPGKLHKAHQIHHSPRWIGKNIIRRIYFVQAQSQWRKGKGSRLDARTCERVAEKETAWGEVVPQILGETHNYTGLMQRRLSSTKLPPTKSQAFQQSIRGYMFICTALQYHVPDFRQESDGKYSQTLRTTYISSYKTFN